MFVLKYYKSAYNLSFTFDKQFCVGGVDFPNVHTGYNMCRVSEN